MSSNWRSNPQVTSLKITKTWNFLAFIFFSVFQQNKNTFNSVELFSFSNNFQQQKANGTLIQFPSDHQHLKFSTENHHKPEHNFLLNKSRLC